MDLGPLATTTVGSFPRPGWLADVDRSRAEYELELKTDLGDSMVLYSRSNAERLRAAYAHELAYQRLAALVGADFLRRTSTAPQ